MEYQLIFDGVNIKKDLEELNSVFAVLSVNGLGVLSKDNSATKVAGVDGERFISTSFPTRIIEVNYGFTCLNEEHRIEVENRLTVLLSTTSPRSLKFWDDGGHYKAILSSAPTSRVLPTFQEGTIQFICHDPYKYRERVNTDSVAVVQNGSFQVNNSSNWESPMELTIVTNASASSLEVKVNGVSISFTPETSIVSGTTIVISSETYEVRVAGILKVLEIDGVFSPLQPGINTIQVNTACTARVSFTERDI